MKKILLFAVAIIGFCSCNPNGYVLDGNISGLKDYVYLLDQEGSPIDSVYAEKGEFQFKGDAEKPSVNYLKIGASAEKQFAVTLILEPGKIFVTGNIDQPEEVVTGGTPSNEANNAYTQENYRLIALFRTPGISPEESAALENEYSALSRKALNDNQDNFFGAVILSQRLVYEMRASEILEIIAKFPEALQQTELLQQTKSMAENKLRTEEGQPYIDVMQNNGDSQPISLKSVIENPANKYVLIDFWASWCTPCMEEVPYLLEDYKNYHDKGFEIYGISFDTDRNRWLETISKHEMNWIHVSDLNRFDNQAGRDYAVNSIPANFLVECSTGKIIAVNLRGAALGEKLAELLQ